MTEVIYAIQATIAVALGLWTYNRFAKRWTSTLGDDVVSGYVNDVGYVAGEGGGSVIVSYGYSVDGTQYFGSFVPPWRHLLGFDFKMRTAELEAIFREKYPKGYEVRVFYFPDSCRALVGITSLKMGGRLEGGAASSCDTGADLHALDVY